MSKYAESLVSNIGLPSVHYNDTLECFISLDQSLGYSLGSTEILTSTQQLEDLVEVFGTEGIAFLVGQVEQDIGKSVKTLIKIIKVTFRLTKVGIKMVIFRNFLDPMLY